jgi:hypothetical protein
VVLWVGVGLGIVIIFAVRELLERYAARRGDGGYRTRNLASSSGMFVGVGFAMLFTTPLSGLGVLAVGAGFSTFFLLWYRRPRVGPPSR